MKYTESSIQEFLSFIEINDQVCKGKREIGANFKRMRQSAELTQKNIADFLSIAPQNIYKFEIGERSFDYNTVCQLCDYMNTDVKDLFIGTKEICLTYTYLTQFIDNRDKLSYTSPATNKILNKPQQKKYNSLRKWSCELLNSNGINVEEVGINFGVRNVNVPLFHISFPKKGNTIAIQKFIENNFCLSQRKRYIEEADKEIVLAVLSKELEKES
ncbi:hypothetical protein C2D64_08470 [Listeria ivanovii]|uniref:helix-turn-helix domain-containing protein n=1 Tax=Listeria ivanovii TaxID=1638 RepID=UPI000DA95B22|nr:helix-turn-helix transcriptional regulator [Listeria ivanovii]PZG33367.1 hypothetical protein C2D64_08470 [Listeria ivanovii]PZG47126.1 hypothetical protein C2D66_08250 [Listeria ivanovii]PZH11018.1 hypothetical protein C2D65_08420 [Listeria ivanovii]